MYKFYLFKLYDFIFASGYAGASSLNIINAEHGDLFGLKNLLCYHKHTKLYLPTHKSDSLKFMYPALQTHIEDPSVFTHLCTIGSHILSPLTHSSTSDQ